MKPPYVELEESDRLFLAEMCEESLEAARGSLEDIAGMRGPEAAKRKMAAQMRAYITAAEAVKSRLTERRATPGEVKGAGAQSF